MMTDAERVAMQVELMAATRRGWKQTVDASALAQIVDQRKADLREAAKAYRALMDQVDPALQDGMFLDIRNRLDAEIAKETMSLINLDAVTDMLMAWGNYEHQVYFDSGR